MAFRRWSRIVKARELKENLNFENFNKLKKLCQSVNKVNKLLKTK